MVPLWEARAWKCSKNEQIVRTLGLPAAFMKAAPSFAVSIIVRACLRFGVDILLVRTSNQMYWCSGNSACWKREAEGKARRTVTWWCGWWAGVAGSIRWRNSIIIHSLHGNFNCISSKTCVYITIEHSQPHQIYDTDNRCTKIVTNLFNTLQKYNWLIHINQSRRKRMKTSQILIPSYPSSCPSYPSYPSCPENEHYKNAHKI